MKIGAAPGLRKKIEDAQTQDLKSVSMPFSVVAPAGAYLGLTLMSTFKSENAYLLTGLEYSLRPFGVFFLNLKVALTDNPVALQQGFAIGRTLLDVECMGEPQSQIPPVAQTGVRNWTPYGWYLPATYVVGIFVNAYAPYADEWQGGVVTLFLSETFE